MRKEPKHGRKPRIRPAVDVSACRPFAGPGYSILDRAALDYLRKRGIKDPRIVHEEEGFAIRKTQHPCKLSPASCPPWQGRGWTERNRCIAEALGELLDEAAVEDLEQVAGYALRILANKARNCDGVALWVFASLTVESAEELSWMVGTNRKVFQPLASRLMRWPLMMSRNTQDRDPLERLREIKLGVDVLANFSESLDSKGDVARRWALALLEHIQAERARGNALCAELLPFTAQSANSWWCVAAAFFKRSFPDVSAVGELSDLLPPSKRAAEWGGKSVSPSTKRDAVLAVLKARFMQLASEKGTEKKRQESQRRTCRHPS